MTTPHGRKHPVLAHLPFAMVLAVVAFGLFRIVLYHWRQGTVLIGVALFLAAALRGLGRMKRWPRDGVLFHEHDRSDWVVVLMAGRVKVATGTPAGGEVVLAVRDRGALIGELGAIGVALTPGLDSDSGQCFDRPIQVR